MTENTTTTKKYNIEGNIDFYKELLENVELDYNDSDRCLITHEPLNESSVTLECNHSFNYLPLYKYVVNSKTQFNNMEKKSLKVSQIKCPYCRNIQNHLLPLPPSGMDVKIIHGVNKIEYSPIMVGKCCYGDGSCKSTSVYLAYQDNTTYCFTHRSLMKKKWEKEEKTKHKCTYLYTRGINKGLPCGQTITKNHSCGLCVKHAKQKEKMEL
jgi:hypothetical protein